MTVFRLVLKICIFEYNFVYLISDYNFFFRGNMKKCLSILIALSFLSINDTKAMEQSDKLIVKKSYGIPVPRDAEGNKIQADSKLGILFFGLHHFGAALYLLKIGKPGFTPDLKINLEVPLNSIEIKSNEAKITNPSQNSLTISLPELEPLVFKYFDYLWRGDEFIIEDNGAKLIARVSH